MLVRLVGPGGRAVSKLIAVADGIYRGPVHFRPARQRPRMHFLFYKNVPPPKNQSPFIPVPISCMLYPVLLDDCRLHYFGARSFSVLIQARFLSISINITCIALQIHAHRSNAHRAASKPAERWRKAPLKAPRRLSVRPHGRAIAPPPDERGGVGTSGSARVRMTRTTRSTFMHLSHEKAA